MNAGSLRYALIRPVPDSYDRCIRKGCEKIDVDLAKRQHAEYCRELQRLGLELIWVKGDSDLPDSCFVEDTAVVFGEKAVICNMLVESRKEEVAEVARVLKQFKGIHYITEPATMDGGDVLKIEDRVLVGVSARTNSNAAGQLRRILRDSMMSVIPVEVHNALHLKSACTYLGNGFVVLSEGCFETDALQAKKRIVVPKGDEYAADCLAINGTVLLARGHTKTRTLIEREGFPVVELDMSEFRKGDGALTCLSIVW